MRRQRGLRIVGSGEAMRLRPAGDWEREPLEGLAESRRVAGALDKLQRQLVDGARIEGRTWTEIGDSLGISKQSAWERFARPAVGSPRRGHDD
jgi:DNA-directed RNA polymerase specialized sigma24 family protein